MTPPSPTSTDSTPTSGRAPQGPSRPRGRRVTVLAFVVSAIVHALAVALYPLFLGPPSIATAPSIPPDPRPARAMDVVRIAEAPPAPELSPAEPRPDLEEPDDPAEPLTFEVDEDPDPTPEPIGPLDVRPRTPAEELRPRPGDPRLNRALPEEVVEINKEWLAELRIIWAIETLNDSATAVAAAAAAAHDWTYTDEDGKKWGVSPGKIHLGDITLPLPFSFSAPYDSDAARNAREDAEILRAAIEAATRETLEERARAIRERRDRERANGTPPDTTRGGGGGGR